MARANLLAAFDNFASSLGPLTAPTESEFARLLKLREEHNRHERRLLQEEISCLKADNKANGIKLKHARKSFNEEMKKRVKAEAIALHCRQQVALMREILHSKDCKSLLSEEELRNLSAIGGGRLSVGTGSESSQLSQVSVEPLEDELEMSAVRSGARWTRRRTRSIENKLDDDRPPAKRISLNKELKVEPGIHPEKQHHHHVATSNTPPPVPDELHSFFETTENTTPPTGNQDLVAASPHRQSSGDGSGFRSHNLAVKKIKRMDVCRVCRKRIGFGRSVHKCKVCHRIFHLDCRDALPCVGMDGSSCRRSNTGGGNLDTFCPASSPRVPPLVRDCMREVEKRGLSEPGIYHVCGSELEVQDLKEKFLLRGKSPPDLSQVEDIHVVCGVLKEFVCGLSEPLVTHRLHGAFGLAADTIDPKTALAQVHHAVALLPPTNRHTLAALVLHLKRVTTHHRSNLMSEEGLAQVFGPVIVGHSCIAPGSRAAGGVSWQEAQRQPKVVLQLLRLSEDYWTEQVARTSTATYKPTLDCWNTDQFAASPVGSVSPPRDRLFSIGSPVSLTGAIDSNSAPCGTPIGKSESTTTLLGPVQTPESLQSAAATSVSVRGRAGKVGKKKHGPFFGPVSRSNK